MRTDEYGEVLNDPETYTDIAEYLHKTGRVLIGWTDTHGTHFDILFVNGAIVEGPIQGGIRGYNDLIVSIMRKGAFAFEITGSELHPSYISEKLSIGGGVTAEALTELIQGVKLAL